MGTADRGLLEGGAEGGLGGRGRAWWVYEGQSRGRRANTDRVACGDRRGSDSGGILGASAA